MLGKRIVVPLAAVLMLAMPFAALAGEKTKSLTVVSSKAEQGWLGVRVQKINGGLAEALDREDYSGVLINHIQEDSPAAQAGLEEGDILIEIDGEEISRPGDLKRAVRDHSPGDEIQVAYVRDGREKSLKVALAESQRFPRRLNKPGKVVRELMIDRERGFLGVVTESLRGGLGEYFGVEDNAGALISEVVEDSPAEKLGLQAGDVIIEIDDEKIASPAALRRAVGQHEEETDVRVVWVRDRRERSGDARLELRQGRDFSFGWMDSDHGPFDLKNVRRHVRMMGDGGDFEEGMKEMKEELSRMREEIERLKDEADDN